MFTPRGGVLVPPTPSPQGRQLFQKIIATEIRTKTAFVTDELYVENVNIMSVLSDLQGGGGGGAELASLSAYTNNVLAVNLSSQSLSVYSVFGTTVALSGSVNTLSGSLNTLSGSLNTLSGSVNTLSGSVNTLFGSVDTLSTTVANLGGGITVASIGGLAEISAAVGSSGFMAYYDYSNQAISLVESVGGASLVSVPGLRMTELSASFGMGVRLKMSTQLTPAFTGFTFAARYAVPISGPTEIVFQVGQNPGNGAGCACFSSDHRIRTGTNLLGFPGQANQYDGPTGFSFGPYRTLLVTYDPDGIMTAYDTSGNVKRTWSGLNLDNPTFPGQNYIVCKDARVLIQGLVLYNRPLDATEIERVYHALANTPIDPTAGLPSPAPGTVTLYAGTHPSPVGSVPCDGMSLYRSTYASLFNEIGTTFGAGDGTNTFNVPDYVTEMVTPLNSKYVIKL
jgi:hypothetical protein